jgi:hypothetical protein
MYGNFEVGRRRHVIVTGPLPQRDSKFSGRDPVQVAWLKNEALVFNNRDEVLYMLCIQITDNETDLLLRV